ncbi:uncharacterized protein LOC126665226 [Mercurialis annua]|uniref:uncharacterized protein LOC126665226 n=1 Tax=Mercurialis annua TaxID=3986 RepID=UPI00215EC976|nr:uncharacterized protein LOC126665226 [Mercurialis annua]
MARCQTSEVMRNIMSDQASVQRHILNNFHCLSKAMENLGKLFPEQSVAEQSNRRAEQNQTPSRFGYTSSSAEQVESTAHILLDCAFVWQVWSYVMRYLFQSIEQ